MSRFERENIRRMQGYTPGEQLADQNIIKLNTNENPYPPGKRVADALAGIQAWQLRRYPQPLAQNFREAAARIHKLTPDNIIPTNGGDELLRLAITTYTGPGDTLAIAEPGYSLYPILAEIQGCRLSKVPLNPDWSIPENFASQLNEANARMAMLVNPHAPSGRLTSASSLLQIAREFEGVLLVDEAYVDFVDPRLDHDLTAEVVQQPNLLLLRTLSKGYSLAGLRFGYGIGNTSLLEPMLYKTRDSYNTDFISQQLAVAALDDQQAAALTWKQVRQDRELLTDELAKMGITCVPGQANFVLASVPSPLNAESVYRTLKQQGILVRYFDQDRLRDKLRITVGTPEQNNSLLQALKNLSQRTYSLGE